MVSSVGQIVVMSLAVGALSSGVSLSVAEHMQESALERSWSAELQLDQQQNKKETPIQRVVKLLTEMKTELEKEAAKDQELYDQMVCWCETSEKEKTKAIADAEAKDLDLVSEIEERSARHGVLSTEIEYTKGEIGEDVEAAAKAMEMREKDAAEFMSTEKEMVQAITNLKNAVMVLGKVQLTQLPSEVLASLGPVLRDVSEKHEAMLGEREGAMATRKALKAALISLGTDTRRQSSEDGSATSMALRGLRTALNPYAGSELLGEVPVKFAAQVLARRAREGSVVTAFVQKGTRRASHESQAPASA